MKKLIVIVTLLLLMVLIGLGFAYGSPVKDYSNIIVLLVFLLLFSAYIYFEKAVWAVRK